MAESGPCNHIALTRVHCSVEWCVRCQHWHLRSSLSGRRMLPGVVVLTEELRSRRIDAEQCGPEELAEIGRHLLRSAQEHEIDSQEIEGTISR